MSAKSRITAGTIAAFLLQTLMLGAMVAKHVHALRTGDILILKATPADPRHPLLGHYLALSFPISTAESRLADEAGVSPGQVVHVSLEQAEDGGWRIAGLHSAMPPFSSGRPVLRARLVRRVAATPPAADDSNLRDLFHYGIERYYLDEWAAKTMEQRLRGGEIQLEIAVSRSTGRAVIRRILVNGVPAYQDPLF